MNAINIILWFVNISFRPFPSDKAASLSNQYKDEDIYGNLEEIAL